MQVRTRETSRVNLRGQRADDVLAMQRSARKGGSGALLRWFAQRASAEILLFGADGTVLASAGPHAAAQAEHAWRVAGELYSRRASSLLVEGESCTILAVSLDEIPGQTAPVLAAVAPNPVPGELALLLADVSSILGLCWRAERAEQQQRRVELAEAGSRETVLHLLMSGHISTARQIADVLKPALPDVIRFHVVKSPPRLRSAVTRECALLAPGSWVVPCPVYHDHILVLVPAAPGSAAGDSQALASAITEISGDYLVGVSENVPLRETATGYAQAFHALVTARRRTGRWATFHCRRDPALMIGPAVTDWAEHVLAPLRMYCARRPQDPGRSELADTAASWLTFSSQATAHLKIHRNTLSARLRQIESILSLDLDRLADQSLLALALRACTVPHTPPNSPLPRSGVGEHTRQQSLDDLLAHPAVTDWALHLLRPVKELAPGGLARTLDTWLRNDGRLAPTAAELSLSTTAVRKRLSRVEELLERSLLRSPSDRHDLWLAWHAQNLMNTVGSPRTP